MANASGSAARSKTASRSKELLKMENPEVSRDKHLARLFSETPASKTLSTQRLAPCSVLSRVRSFLPELKAANDDLKAAIASGKNVDIEDVDPDADQIIEMNIALLDVATDAAAAPPSPSDESESSSEDSDSDDDGPELDASSPISSGIGNVKYVTEIDSK